MPKLISPKLTSPLAPPRVDSLMHGQPRHQCEYRQAELPVARCFARVVDVNHWRCCRPRLSGKRRDAQGLDGAAEASQVCHAPVHGTLLVVVLCCERPRV